MGRRPDVECRASARADELQSDHDQTPTEATALQRVPDERLDVRDIARRTAFAAVVVIGGMLALGVIARVAVFDTSLGSAERDLMDWIANQRVGVLDTLATQGSAVSDTWTVIGVLIGAVIILLATRRVRCAAVLVIGIGVELTTFLIVGTIIARPRPDVQVLHNVPSTASFPSGHVAGAFVLYGSLTLVARAIAPPGRVPMAIWLVPIAVACLVGWSRVYEGVHHPTDVVAGFVLGLAAVWAAAFATRFPESSSRSGEIGSRAR